MNAGFTLRDALARVEYFARLGISHLYLSPILMARRGSMHGYDVVDPSGSSGGGSPRRSRCIGRRAS
jgi:(1->4)-alpha-D-glucan 1-alpha-D-glucosylmutase